jgi:group II intron reverse transcriptase/maturase
MTPHHSTSTTPPIGNPDTRLQEGQYEITVPVIGDRILQALTLTALEPEWEARFEPKTYGFRPGRGCHDAIEAIFNTVSGRNPQRRWVLDADLAAAFDRLDHGHILDQIGTFPARRLIEQWLTAGVVEQEWFTPTDEGTPQGGVISPALLNVALHGMEQAAEVRYRTTGGNVDRVVPGSPVLVKYADDLVVMCDSREQVEQVKQRLTAWLAPRGLTFNEAKTRTVRLEEGFEFLGMHIRRYRNGKLLIKPSKAAVQRIRKRLTTEMRALRGAPTHAVVTRLNPIIRGWSAYYRSVVSKKTFVHLDPCPCSARGAQVRALHQVFRPHRVKIQTQSSPPPTGDRRDSRCPRRLARSTVPTSDRGSVWFDWLGGRPDVPCAAVPQRGLADHGVVAIAHVRVDCHDLLGHHDEGAHHAFVLVLEDVAVVHEAAAGAAELADDRHQLTLQHTVDHLPGHPNGVLPALLVGVERARAEMGHRSGRSADRRIETVRVEQLAAEYLKVDQM